MSLPLRDAVPHEPAPILPASPSIERTVLKWDALLRQVANAVPVMVWMCGADGRATLFNKRWVEFTGCSLETQRGTYLGDGWVNLVHPQDQEERVATVQKAWRRREPFEAIYRMRRADGEYRWVMDRGTPQSNPVGDFCGYVGVVLDVTERREAIHKLRWLSKAVEQSPACVILTDLNGNIEYVNPKFTEITGYQFAEVIGKNPRILKSGETPPEEYRRLWETIRTGEWRGEFHNRKKSGELYWEAATISPIRDATGKPAGFIGIKEDITERKRMEAALRASEERFRMAAESAGLCVYDVDMETGDAQVFGADEFLTNLGPTADWARALHPDDRERIEAAIARRRRAGGQWQEEYRLVDAAGNVHYCRDHGAAEVNRRFIGALQDITESKKAEQAQARLASIVEYSSDAIFAIDNRAIIQTWNSAAEKMYGYRAAEIIGKSALDLASPARRALGEQNLMSVLCGNLLQAIESEHMRKDGVVFPVSITASPILDAQGKPAGSSASVRDITEQKRARQALIESENRFRALVQNSNDVVTLIDREAVILYDTPGILELLGVSAEDRLGHKLFEWLHPDEIAYMRMMHDELTREPAIRLRAQTRLRHADGTWRWCDSWATNLIEEPGVRALVLSFRDITEQKAAETALRDSELRYRKLIEDASDAIFTIDLEGNFTSVNRIGERITGYDRRELLTMNLRQLAAPESLEVIWQAIEMQRRGEVKPALETEAIARDGRRIALEVSGRLQVRNGRPEGMLCIARDISQRKRAERLDLHRREVLEMVAQNQPLDGILRRLEEMIEHYYPGAVAHIVLTSSSGFMHDAAQHFGSSYQGSLDVPIRAGNGHLLGMLEIRRPEPWQVCESDQTLLHSEAKLASIAVEHRLLTDRLAHQAHHDPLTGLPNRALLEDRLRQAISLARRQGKLVAVLYVDLDRFKCINDTLGHDVGDMLLKEAGQRLAKTVRGSDTLARTGGDEFVAVLTGIETVRDAEIIGDRILDSMRDPFQVRGQELYASASVGLSVFPEDGDDPATLQKHADVAMYEAKNRGRNRFQRFARELNSSSSERLEIENDLHRALERDELELYYQPQFQFSSGQLDGVEALVRWNHPKWGLVAPDRFIPVAEESGLIIPVSLWVLREACRQQQAWKQSGHPPVRVAVNVSATQFMRSNLPETVAEVMAAYGVQPGFLELELTEGVLMVDAADSARQIAELRALGVRISIDDFGTGYSSLSYLQRLPIDDLKIDRCFVRGIDQAKTVQPLVQAIVGLAHGFNVTATAEGVETESEATVLRALGCDRVQGFLFGTPMPPRACEMLWEGPLPQFSG